MSCDNLCTAAKCAELEERISRLEQALDLLEASFEAHTNQDIPQAHNYEEPEVNVSLATSGQDIKVFVKVGNKSDDETITLPIPEEPEVNVSLATAGQDLKVFVKVGNKSDDETITLPKYEPVLDVNLDINSLNFLTCTVQLDDQIRSDSVLLPEIDLDKLIDLINNLKDELKKLIKDILTELLDDLIEEIFKLIKDLLLNDPEINRGNLYIYGSYEGRSLNLTIGDGFSSNSTSIYIPRGGGGSEEEPKFLTGSATYNDDILRISLNSSIGDTTFEVEIPMCDLDNLERLVGEIHDYTVIDITGETVQDFKCLDPDNPDIPQNQLIAYEGKGINGLHQLVKTINTNLLPIFTNSCEKPVLASPDWWQVRLGGNRPQIVCSFIR